MHIEFDYDFDQNGVIFGRHFIDTAPGAYPQTLIPGVSAVLTDVIQYINALHKATLPIAGTGWDVITKHPTYPGQTRLAALLGEIVRLNDAPSRAILGV